MNNKFDELAKGLAQSVTRRQALKRFGLAVAGMALACVGIRRAPAQTKKNGLCGVDALGQRYTGYCFDPSTCQSGPSTTCQGLVKGAPGKIAYPPCPALGVPFYDESKHCSF